MEFKIPSDVRGKREANVYIKGWLAGYGKAVDIEGLPWQPVTEGMELDEEQYLILGQSKDGKHSFLDIEFCLKTRISMGAYRFNMSDYVYHRIKITMPEGS